MGFEDSRLQRARRAAATFGVLLWICPAAVAAQDLPTPAQNAMAGAQVFGEKGCIRCHSLSGEGGALGPDLRSIVTERSLQDLTATLWNHLPDMRRAMMELRLEQPRLSPREAGDLFAYLYTLGYFDERGDSLRGERLFSEMSCIRCHQVGGVGGVVGPVLDGIGARGAPIELATSMWNHGPAMLEAAQTRGIDRPRLAGRDISDMLAYLESARRTTPAEDLHLLPGDPRSGEALIEERGCADCHGAPGGGGGRAPDLAGIARGTSLVGFVASMWNKAPAMISALRAGGEDFPQLSPQEVADLVAFLYAVNYFSDSGSTARGRALLAEKGCTRCHAVDGRGGDPDIDLASVRGMRHPASITAALWNHLFLLNGEEEDDMAWPTLTGDEMGDLMAFFQASSP